jgi:hypothetical protein
MDFTVILAALLAAATPFVLTVFVPMAIQFVKLKVWPNIPAYLLPIAAPILGLLFDYGLGLLGAAPIGNAFMAAILGALGVWAHEFVKQFKDTNWI